jgi:IS605 OrfB family transposase
LIRTFETRLDLREEEQLHKVMILDAYAALIGRIERTLYARIKAGVPWRPTLRNSLYKEFGISARQLDHIGRALIGKLDSISELAKQRHQALEMKVRKKTKQIKSKTEAVETELDGRAGAFERYRDLEEKVSAAREKLATVKPAQRKKCLAAFKKKLDSFHAVEAALAKSTSTVDRLSGELHQHQRKLRILIHKQAIAEKQIVDPAICFGTKKLFKAQFNLEANGFSSHAEWKKKWQSARTKAVMIEGAAAAEGGNRFARLKPREDGKFDLELRFPQALKDAVPHRTVSFLGLSFNHGNDAVLEALANGQPVSVRLHRDDKSWKVMVTVDQKTPQRVRDYSRGAVGVDLNVGFVSVSRVDGHGNVVETFDISCDTYGKSEEQSRDILRKLAARITAYAEPYAIPVVSERLDFQKKKDQLTSESGPRYARMLSSFAYSAFDTALGSACARRGVYHARVNPAYTSIIGRSKLASRHGLSTHAAAAVTIARRAMGLSERLPRSVERERRLTLPLNNAHHVTLDLPARKDVSGEVPKSRHVWTAWNGINRAFKGALAAHGPSRRKRPRPRPVGNGGRGRNDLRSMAHRHRRDVPDGVVQSSGQGLDSGAVEAKSLGAAQCGLNRLRRIAAERIGMQDAGPTTG